MEFSGYLRFIFALLFVLGLIGGLTVLARRFGFGFPSGARTGNRRRLRVLEALSLDGKRRLVLFQRDDAEYMVLLGAASETLIEGPLTPAAHEPAPAADEDQTPLIESAKDPA